MHHYQDIQSLGWMKDKTNKRIQSLPRRQGLVIYFDVSNRKPAFLNSFHLLCSDEPDIVANMCTQISSAFSRSQLKAVLAV
jgi:hypothetical protein